MNPIQKSVQGGVLRPLRKLGLSVASRWPWPVAARMKTGRSMYVDLRSGVGRAIYMQGEFDPAVFEPFKSCLTEGGVFLDVGANVGYYTMRALDYVGQSGAAHCFEIDPRPLRCLRRTVGRQGLGNVFVHELAVGNTTGRGRLTMREDAGHSSVGAQGNGPEVQLTTLDDWRKLHPEGRIQAIKMDIEGGELAALQGAHELLRRERPLLVCEVITESQGRKFSDPDKIFALLELLGYRWHRLEGTFEPTIVAVAESV
jgi:FkbM family methyltransferase